MIVCVCRGLTDKKIRAAINAGTLAQCLKDTKNSETCGLCTPCIEKLHNKMRDEQSRDR